MLARLRAAALAAALALAASAPTGAEIVSTFDFELDGWTTDNTGPFTPMSLGGNPGGYAELDNDEASTAHLFAPAKFHGDLSAYDGGSVSFDGLLVSGPAAPTLEGPDDYGVVRVSTLAFRASARFGPRGGFPSQASADLAPDGTGPGKGWQTFSVPFTAAAFGVTQPQWEAILANVVEIRVTLEHYPNPTERAVEPRGVTPNEAHGFDNFRLAEGAPPSDDLAPFLCYEAKPTKGSAGFEPRDVTLVDSFETRETQVVKPKALCNPAALAGVPAPVPDAHFESYQIRQSEKHEKVRGILLQTELGLLAVDTTKPDRLLVPAAKDLAEPPAPPAEPAFDHLKCYKVKPSKGFPKLPKGTTAQVADQFAAARTFAVKKPSRLCVPADKNGEGVQHPDVGLACFKAAPAKGQPKHEKRAGVFLAQQFGVEQLDTVKEEELCFVAVPADGEVERAPD
jgi:hypothetical protein